MPKFFCDYCDVYLTHDSMSVRKAHNSGRNHLRNVVEYYQQIGHEKAQSVIDSITNSYAAEGQSGQNPMLQAQAPMGGPPGFPPAGFPPGPGGGPPMSMPPGMPPGMPPMPFGRGLPPMPPGFPPAPTGFPPGMGPPGAPGSFPPQPPSAGPHGQAMPFSPPNGMPFPPNMPPNLGSPAQQHGAAGGPPQHVGGPPNAHQGQGNR